MTSGRAHQAHVPAVALDRQDTPRARGPRQTRVGLNTDHGPVSIGDGSTVHAAGVDQTGIYVVLGQSNDSQFGEPGWCARCPAGGVYHQVGRQLRLSLAGFMDSYTGDLAPVPEQSDDFGPSAYVDPGVLEDPLPYDVVRQIPTRGHQVVSGALPAAVPLRVSRRPCSWSPVCGEPPRPAAGRWCRAEDSRSR